MPDDTLPVMPDTPAWGALRRHFQQVRDLHMRDLFAAEPGRYARYSLEAAGLLLDYSKNRITADTVKLLLALARERDVEGAIGRMFAGERINTTEHRAALHTALRNRSGRPVTVDGEDVMPGVQAVLEQMRRFVASVHSGAWRGFSGRPITDVVNIGIGGSHLGPMLAVRALEPYAQGGLQVHFVSNVDPSDISRTLNSLNPQTTLFVVASKSFTTQETMLNARTAREWLLRGAPGPEAVARHFVAVSTNLEATGAFGIAQENVFAFWDWVGGRYSLWSAIGLPVALYLGMDHFEELLGGGFAMDEHFRSTELEHNLPVVMGLLGVWYNNFFATQSRAVVPYDEYLCHLPAYLQQLEMESNGKRIQRDGAEAPWPTAPVVWGSTGTNGQHAFFQLLHQGNRLVPVDFLAPLEPQHPTGEHHAWLLSNCFAQSEALMRGRTADEARAELAGKGGPQAAEELVPHKVFPGNRPSNTLLYRRLTPAALGTLIALYEHKVYVEGVLWNINSFDQWGVELGKQLAGKIRAELAEGGASADHDASTRGLIDYYLKHA